MAVTCVDCPLYSLTELAWVGFTLQSWEVKSLLVEKDYPTNKTTWRVVRSLNFKGSIQKDKQALEFNLQHKFQVQA